MSDIGFAGLAAALVGVIMLVVAIAGVLAEALLRWRRKRPAASAAVVFVAPVVYAVIALVILLVADRGSLDWKERLDRWSLPIAGIGALIWCAVRLRARRRVAGEANDARPA